MAQWMVCPFERFGTGVMLSAIKAALVETVACTLRLAEPCDAADADVRHSHARRKPRCRNAAVRQGVLLGGEEGIPLRRRDVAKLQRATSGPRNKAGVGCPATSRATVLMGSST